MREPTKLLVVLTVDDCGFIDFRDVEGEARRSTRWTAIHERPRWRAS
jgi:hypothetical protein